MTGKLPTKPKKPKEDAQRTTMHNNQQDNHNHNAAYWLGGP